MARSGARPPSGIARVPGRSGGAGAWTAIPWLVLAGCADPGAPLAIVDVTLLDGSGAAPIPRAVLVVDEGRIRCADAPPACEPPPGSRQVQGGGRWVIPGLIDTHTRPSFESAPELTELEERLRFMFGVTATHGRSAPEELEANLAARARHVDPGRPVPRLLIGGEVARPDRPPDSRSRSMDDEPGVDTLAAGLSGLSDLNAIAPPAVDSATLASAPDPAADPDAWQVWRKGLWARAAEAVLEEEARRLAARGVWLEPLLVAEEDFRGGYRIPDPLVGILDLGFVRDRAQKIRFAERPEDVGSGLDSALARMRGFVRAFQEAGGVVVTGTGGLLIPGLNLHEEIRALVRAGLTPAAALAAATRDAARAIGAADSLGTLEPGKLADFVVLDADPLADVANAMRAWRVAKGGRLYDPNVLFEILVESGAGTLSRSRTRLLGAGLALAGVLAALLVVLVRHRRRLAGQA